MKFLQHFLLILSVALTAEFSDITWHILLNGLVPLAVVFLAARNEIPSLYDLLHTVKQYLYSGSMVSLL
jgi:hypothetical protein